MGNVINFPARDIAPLAVAAEAPREAPGAAHWLCTPVGRLCIGMAQAAALALAGWALFLLMAVLS